MQLANIDHIFYFHLMDSMPQRETKQRMLCKNYKGFLCFSRIFPALPDRSEGSGAPGGNNISVEKTIYVFVIVIFDLFTTVFLPQGHHSFW